MSKRYAEPIEVEATDGGLEAFRWRGRRYGVRRVISRWREAGGWWEEDAGRGRAPGAAPDGVARLGRAAERPWLAGDAREILRVEARALGNGAGPGVYEIARDLRTGAWTLQRVWD